MSGISYPEDDPSSAKLRQNLAKYGPDADTINRIVPALHTIAKVRLDAGSPMAASLRAGRRPASIGSVTDDDGARWVFERLFQSGPQIPEGPRPLDHSIMLVALGGVRNW